MFFFTNRLFCIMGPFFDSDFRRSLFKIFIFSVQTLLITFLGSFFILILGELVKEVADLIVAPLTINPERAQVMEFSKPFKYQGITILQKRQPRASQLVSFLQPFKSTLWILVLVSVNICSAVIDFLNIRLLNKD